MACSYAYAIQPGGPQSAASLEASRPLDMRSVRRNLEMRLMLAMLASDVRTTPPPDSTFARYNGGGLR